MKKNNKKGFTLAELLIVVAIIAVLVAIAIPIFSSQLEKSREATDVANVRDIYAEVAVGLLDGSLVATNDTMKVMNSLEAKYTAADASGKSTVVVENFPVAQKVDDWQSATAISVAGVSINAPTIGATTTLTFTFQSDKNANGAENTYLDKIELQ